MTHISSCGGCPAGYRIRTPRPQYRFIMATSLAVAAVQPVRGSGHPGHNIGLLWPRPWPWRRSSRLEDQDTQATIWLSYGHIRGRGGGPAESRIRTPRPQYIASLWPRPWPWRRSSRVQDQDTQATIWLPYGHVLGRGGGPTGYRIRTWKPQYGFIMATSLAVEAVPPVTGSGHRGHNIGLLWPRPWPWRRSSRVQDQDTEATIWLHYGHVLGRGGGPARFRIRTRRPQYSFIVATSLAVPLWR